jgi:hypothetical protein
MIGAIRIAGPIFLNRTLIQSASAILQNGFDSIMDDEKMHGYFMQKSDTVYTATYFFNALHEVFKYRLMGCRLLAKISSDFNLYELFFCGELQKTKSMQIILIYGINLRKTSVKQLHLSRTVNANS